MRYSYMMTLHDREPAVILSTLRSLSRCDMTDSEVVIVDDRSNIDMGFVRRYAESVFADVLWCVAEPYSAFRIGDKIHGINGPSRAWNLALLAARGQYVVYVGSDVMVGSRVVDRLRAAPLDEAIWTPMVIDLDSGGQYCGPMRFFPVTWCLAASRAACVAIGGFDEGYLAGACYDDNDFSGRLGLHVGRFLGDWTVAAYHQSHDQLAYMVADQTIAEANQRNREYTLEKWSGIPFDPEFQPFDIVRKPFRNGDISHECRSQGTLLIDTIERTKGAVKSSAGVKA